MSRCGVAFTRRYRAAQMAEAATVPVRIVNLNDAEACKAQLVENLIRADVHLMEESPGSPSYYAQVMFSTHLGDQVLGSKLDTRNPRLFDSRSGSA